MTETAFSFRPLPGLTLATLVALGVLLALGTWQLHRLAWKEDLIAAAATRAGAEPVALEKALLAAGGDLSGLEYRAVRVRGRFDHEREVYQFSQLPGAGAGFRVITPLVEADGGEMLIDRGFVPQRFKAPQTRAAGQITGPVVVEGLIRLTQEPGTFTPPADLETRVFYVRDVPAMAALAGADSAPPLLIAAGAGGVPGDWPKGGTTPLDFTNRHLEYALTWFGFAVILVIIYFVYHHREGRLRLGRSAR